MGWRRNDDGCSFVVRIVVVRFIVFRFVIFRFVIMGFFGDIIFRNVRFVIFRFFSMRFVFFGFFVMGFVFFGFFIVRFFVMGFVIISRVSRFGYMGIVGDSGFLVDGVNGSVEINNFGGYVVIVRVRFFWRVGDGVDGGGGDSVGGYVGVGSGRWGMGGNCVVVGSGSWSRDSRCSIGFFGVVNIEEGILDKVDVVVVGVDKVFSIMVKVLKRDIILVGKIMSKVD